MLANNCQHSVLKVCNDVRHQLLFLANSCKKTLRNLLGTLLKKRSIHKPSPLHEFRAWRRMRSKTCKTELAFHGSTAMTHTRLKKARCGWFNFRSRGTVESVWDCDLMFSQITNWIWNPHVCLHYQLIKFASTTANEPPHHHPFHHMYILVSSTPLKYPQLVFQIINYFCGHYIFAWWLSPFVTQLTGVGAFTFHKDALYLGVTFLGHSCLLLKYWCRSYWDIFLMCIFCFFLYILKVIPT